MAENKTVAQETAAGTLDGTELVRIVQNGNSVRTTAQAIADLSAGGFQNPMTTKGDLIVGGTDGAPARLGVGSDGQVLAADSTQADGVKWVTPGGSAGFLYASNVWVETNGSDSTGVVGNPNLPFQTINAALDASTGPTVIHLGVGAFAPVAGDVDYSNTSTASKLRANLWFKGSKKPTLDSYTAPTKLINGTIINGPIAIEGNATRSGIAITDLGFDAGSVFVAAHGSWSPADGLTFPNVGQVVGKAPMHGLVVDHVIALCATPATQVHAFLFENIIDPQVTNIEGYYGVHGVAWKCIGGYCRGVISRGHNWDTVIIKESNLGNASAPCNSTMMTDISGGALNAGDTPIGVVLQSAGPNFLEHVIVDNVNLKGITDHEVGIFVDGASTAGVRNCQITNLYTDNGTVRITQTGSGIDQGSIYVNGTNLYGGEFALTDGAHIATNCAVSQSFHVTLGGNRVLDNPTNPVAGKNYTWRIVQDGTGSRTLAYGSFFAFPASTAPVLSTSANAVDLLTAHYSATDGLFLASLQKAFGVPVNPGPLDPYTTNLLSTFGLQKMLTTYSGNAIRVRRDSDNTTMDIGFIGNVLDTSTMLSFVGSGSGYVAIWYDQSAAANHLTQTTQSKQPKIVNAGSYLGQVLFDGVSQDMDWNLLATQSQLSIATRSTMLVLPGSSVSWITSANFSNSGHNTFSIQHNPSGTNLYNWASSGSFYAIQQSQTTTENVDIWIFDRTLAASCARYTNGSSNNGSVQSGSTITGTLDAMAVKIASNSGTSGFANVAYKSLSMWSSNQSANAAGISAAI